MSWGNGSLLSQGRPVDRDRPNVTLQIPREKRLAMVMTVELPIAQISADAPRAPSARLSRFARPALGLLLPLSAALAWELIVWLGYSNGRLVPPPSRVFETIVDLARSGELTRHIV